MINPAILTDCSKLLYIAVFVIVQMIALDGSKDLHLVQAVCGHTLPPGFGHHLIDAFCGRTRRCLDGCKEGDAVWGFI